MTSEDYFSALLGGYPFGQNLAFVLITFILNNWESVHF